MSRKNSVPRPEKNSVVAGGKPVIRGTVKVDPNIATTCWAPMPTVRPQPRRSSGRTTAPGAMVLPSPWTVQPNRRAGGEVVVLMRVHALRVLFERGCGATQDDL